MKVVLVEDNKGLQKVYTEGLGLRGFQVSVAADYSTALSLIKQVQPDVILLDLLMPNVNGLDMLRILKADNRVKAIPVIVLTNLDDERLQHSALELGAATFVIKADITLDQLAETIRTTLS
jgi:DNA-binding response OmpR family regulator